MKFGDTKRVSWWIIPALVLPLAALIMHQWVLLVLLVTALLALLIADIVWLRVHWAIWLLVLSVPLSVNWMIGSTSISIPAELLTAFLAGVFLYRIAAYPTLDSRILTMPLTILLIVLLVWMGITSFFSSDLMVPFKRTVMYGLFLTVYYFFLAHAFRHRKYVLLFFIIFSVAMIVPVLVDWVQHASYNFSPAWSFAVTGPFFDDHTIYGACIAFVLPVLAIFTIKGRLLGLADKHRYALGLLFVFLFAAYFFSFSRAAWLSGLGAMLAFGLIMLRIPFGYWVAGLVLLLAIGYRYQDRLIEQFDQPQFVSHTEDVEAHVLSVVNLETDNSNLERLNRWRCALRMAKDRPIIGFGPGMYQFEYGQYQVASELTYLSTFRGEKGNAHSEYLTALSETGWPGLILFLLIIGATYVLGLRLAYRVPEAADRWLAIAALLGLTTFFVHGAVNAFLDQEKMAILVFGSMAILAGRYLAIKTPSRA